MKCTEFHEQAAGYALDALSEGEREACLQHLEHEGPHEGCLELVQRYGAALGALGDAVEPVPVAPSVWRALELRLGLASKPTAIPRIREALAWSAAAAALLFTLWMRRDDQRTAEQYTQLEGTLTSTSGQLAEARAAEASCRTALAELSARQALSPAAVSLIEHPSTRVLAMASASAHELRATALFNPEVKRAVVISTSLAALPNQDYELWVIAEGSAPKPAGFVHFDASGVAIGQFDEALLSAATPAALAVSVEPKGGRPTPTEVVLVAKLSG